MRVVLIALSVILCFATAVFADTTSIGTVQIGDSWTARFQENGWYGGFQYNFYGIALIEKTGSLFELPAMRVFDNASWSGSLLTATGNAIGYLQWTFYFLDPHVPTTFEYWILMNDSSGHLIRWGTEVTNNGGDLTTDWSYKDLGYKVPEPSLILLLGISTGVVAVLGRRFRN